MQRVDWENLEIVEEGPDPNSADSPEQAAARLQEISDLILKAFRRHLVTVRRNTKHDEVSGGAA